MTSSYIDWSFTSPATPNVTFDYYEPLMSGRKKKVSECVVLDAFYKLVTWHHTSFLHRGHADLVVLWRLQLDQLCLGVQSASQLRPLTSRTIGHIVC